MGFLPVIQVPILLVTLLSFHPVLTASASHLVCGVRTANNLYLYLPLFAIYIYSTHSTHANKTTLVVKLFTHLHSFAAGDCTRPEYQSRLHVLRNCSPKSRQVGQF